jgi:hypothetical protein
LRNHCIKLKGSERKERKRRRKYIRRVNESKSRDTLLLKGRGIIILLEGLQSSLARPDEGIMKMKTLAS